MIFALNLKVLFVSKKNKIKKTKKFVNWEKLSGLYKYLYYKLWLKKDIVAAYSYLVDLEKPYSEAEFQKYYKSVKDALSDIESYPGKGIEYWKLCANLYDKLDKPLRAADCWEKARTELNGKEDIFVNMGLLKNLIEANKLEQAADLMNGAHYLSDHPEYRDIQLKYQIKKDLYDSAYSAAKGIQFLEKKEYSNAAEQFKDSLRLSHVGVEFETKLEPLLYTLVNFAEKFSAYQSTDVKKIKKSKPVEKNYSDHISSYHFDNDNIKENCLPDSVFCCGYLWSGSGAVADFLKQVQHCAPFGVKSSEANHFTDETTFFRHWYGVQSVFDLDINFVTPVVLIKLIMGPVLGLLVHPDEMYRINLWKDRSLLSIFKSYDKVDALINHCNNLIQSIDGGTKEELSQNILQKVAVFANGLLKNFLIPDKVLLMNNSVLASQVRIFLLLENFKAVIVRRDPRDQYVSQFYESNKHDGDLLEEFIRKLKLYRKRVNDTQKINTFTNRILEINFEDFILKETVRNDVLLFCGFTENDLKFKNSFNPEDSKKNIGLYKTFKFKKHIKIIEREFPELLYK